MKAEKPKLMNETLKLVNSVDPTVELEVALLARVLGNHLYTFLITINVRNSQPILVMYADLILGKGQGTPMLKDGIHCIGVQVDEESEASDWQGFD